MSSVSQKIFCAFCRLERKAYFKKSVSWTNVLLSVGGAFLAMFFIWQELDARVTLFFVIFLGLAEIFVRVRWRMALTCPHCGFDPLLYKTDRPKAVVKVNERLGTLRATGKHLLKQNNPFLNLPVRRVSPSEKPVERESKTLSRQV